ncbi:MAG: glutamine amidotransferase [Gemmatimonadota bacterium]|nr:MAG: glutamine amidotransferase [Gemmatimonadota bacterium]
MKPILIIKAGTTFEATARAFGDFEDWTIRGMGLSKDAVRVLAVFRNESLPTDDSFCGVVVTGSHAMVTDREPWSEELAGWIRGIIERGTPFLGLCYGHQLLAYAMGGHVGNHPRGREIGTVRIEIEDKGAGDELISILPREFLGHVTHTQTVLRLPPGALILASNAFEPHHAIRVGECAWGVQFHPEFEAAIMRSYINEQSLGLKAEGLDISSLRSGVVETPHAAKILQRFASLVKAGK